MSRPRRVLLISPVFHGYWESISRGLEENGFEVVPFVYDDHASVRAKLANKVVHELPALVGSDAGRRLRSRRTTAAALAALAASRADAVIAVRSDLFLDDLWDAIDDRSLRCILWLYDEVERLAFTPASLGRFPLIASYSRHDVEGLRTQGIDAMYLPNAFDPEVAPSNRRDAAVVFIGARYPGRERTVLELQRRGVPVRCFGRDWSRHPLDRARTWRWQRPDVPAERDVDRADAYGLMGHSPATLNLHEAQDGFTMRTFEAAGVGGLQLIDRRDVEDLYEPGVEIIPFGDDDELAELSARALADERWHREVGAAARRRTLAQHTFGHRMQELTQSWA